MEIMGVVARGQAPTLADEIDFHTEVGGETDWVHVPCLAPDPTAGREFARGTTNERTAHLSDFVGRPMPNATALSAMTSLGGQTIPAGLPFLKGTLVTTVPTPNAAPNCVPCFAGAAFAARTSMGIRPPDMPVRANWFEVIDIADLAPDGIVTNEI